MPEGCIATWETHRRRWGTSEKAAEALPEDGGYKLKSKIYSQMGTLFAYQSMYTEALEMYKKGENTTIY